MVVAKSNSPVMMTRVVVCPGVTSKVAGRLSSLLPPITRALCRVLNVTMVDGHALARGGDTHPSWSPSPSRSRAARLIAPPWGSELTQASRTQRVRACGRFACTPSRGRTKPRIPWPHPPPRQQPVARTPDGGLSRRAATKAPPVRRGRGLRGPPTNYNDATARRVTASARRRGEWFTARCSG